MKIVKIVTYITICLILIAAIYFFFWLAVPIAYSVLGFFIKHSWLYVVLVSIGLILYTLAEKEEILHWINKKKFLPGGKK